MMQKIKTKTLSLFIILLFTLTACGGPGMKAPSKGLKGKNKVYFESKKFNDLIKKLKTEFDYIIIDTPPSLSIADSLVLGRYADLIMTVLRHNNSRSQQYAQVIKDFNQANLNTQYVVYNDFSKPRGYYGYDYYAYKYYGKDDYSYDAKN